MRAAEKVRHRIVAMQAETVPATLIDVTRRHADRTPEKTALKFEGRVTSFADLDRRSNQIGHALLAEGVKAGDHVGYLGKNTDAYFEGWFGAMKIGAIMVPIGWRLAPPEVAFMLADSDIKVLFVGRELMPMADVLAGERPGMVIIAAEESEFANFRERQPQTPPPYQVKPRDICLQLYTSGTTGRPKGAMLTHESFVKHLGAMAAANLEWNRWTSEDVSLLPMPVAHIGGSGWGIYSLFHGATAVVERQFDIDSTFDQIEREKITKMFIVPSALQMLVRHPRARTVDYQRIRHINYGSSPISPTLLRECIDIFRCGFVQMYGMTETIGTIVALPPEDHHPDGTPKMAAAGKPLPGVEIAIVDGAGKPLPPRQVGEILTRSIANMAGYWNLPEATARTLDAEGWVHTGDAGFLDEDGYLYIHDRMKDLIISGAENIYPTEVENVISGHPDVAEVAVIGVPDERWGEAVKAFVVPRAGRAVDGAELIAWCRGKIAGFKMPKSVEVVASLPRNATGKLLKKELRASFWPKDGDGRQIG
jgi:acyl-CoA synthetase (AMP-forming)/AMP-acid ligase II